ncbi:Mbov_0392 family ICE element protein [Mesomycoplasma molare]|uniref:DUF4375 domain-containing protein n=1 Tax=Mesomycoplasma molare TaxID=171288 RepID=A0ABY5TV12_9BACT|nr:hypothetical protein [Mesomycoplasma molare]UWD34497.1 hypothetical protein NX772_01545 [Mesomycoplasma molare]
MKKQKILNLLSTNRSLLKEVAMEVTQTKDFDNYLYDNNIYHSENFLEVLDDNLREKGLDSEYIYLASKVSNFENDIRNSEYIEINAYANDFEIKNYEEVVFSYLEENCDEDDLLNLIENYVDDFEDELESEEDLEMTA